MGGYVASGSLFASLQSIGALKSVIIPAVGGGLFSALSLALGLYAGEVWGGVRGWWSRKFVREGGGQEGTQGKFEEGYEAEKGPV